MTWAVGHGSRGQVTDDPPPPDGLRFPGDPGVGNFYFGGAPDLEGTGAFPPGYNTYADGMTGWKASMEPEAGGKPMGIGRIYLSGSQTTGWSSSSLIQANIDAGRIPHISFKYPTQWGTSGTPTAQMNKALLFDSDWDEWIDELKVKFDSYLPAPIWYTFYHEPEDHRSVTGGSTVGGAGYRAVCRRLKQDLDAIGVTNATFVSGCLTAPYDYGRSFGPVDWNLWYPDWKGTYTGGSTASAPNPVDYYLDGDPLSVVDVIGLDIYNFWNAERSKEEDPPNGSHAGYPNGSQAESLSNYVSFENMWNTISGMNDFLNKPYALGEYGVEAYHTGCWVPAGVGTWTKYNSSTPNLTAPGDAVFGTTNNDRTRANINDMAAGLADWNIIAVEVYNTMLTHDPWRLKWGDPNEIRFSAYGEMMALSNCVLPDLTP